MGEGRKLLFFVTEDWYLCSHRLPIVNAAVAAGYEVSVVTRVRDHAAPIEAAGANLIPLALSRRGRHPLRELNVIRELVRIYRRVQPDLCHHVAMKPVLYGSLAARLAGAPCVVNALGGLGYIFISQRPAARLLRQPVKVAFKLLLGGRGRRVIVQNQDDRELLRRRAGIPARSFVLIAGSGVDPASYPAAPEPAGPVRAAVVARMLWDKGIGEVVAAARLLRSQGSDVTITLAGAPDPENPATITPADIAAWQAEGVVRCLGHVQDIPALWSEHHIAILVSYREGLPRSLLEAAACGRPLIAADVPGCRDLVRDGETGLLVPPRDPQALAAAIRRLAADPDLRRALGTRARAMVEREYTVAQVVAGTLAVYRDLLEGA
ncbi:MAG: glycosyltransferase family 4 protein [Candidatus Krumholzibacteria bacterium]|jgi:glycosyltransferase involved in cell wall biosynthesis|nr:glycosyltransferase family 4 protein [Candidatus Krumholzibacteria bacterium]